jgi:hypothetical protein
MQLVIALSLVVLVSTAFLLYQFWTGSLARDGAEASPDERAGADTVTPLWPTRIDHAA